MENKIVLKYLDDKDQELFKLLSSKDQRGEISNEELIELAFLYEFMHVEEISFQIYERLLKKDPTNSWALFWYSYFLLIYRPPAQYEEKEKVFKFVEHLVNQTGEISGMGYYIKDFYLSFRIPLVESSVEKVYSMCQSIYLCPNWSSNYSNLAHKLEEHGILNEALKLFEKAQSNITLSIDPNWRPSQSYFEECVSSRQKGSYHEADVNKSILRLQKRISEGEPIEPKRSLFAFFRKSSK